jgi:hypothetical protein
VRGDEAVDPETVNELARLSSENRELRAKESASGDTFSGLSLDDLTRLLSEHKVSQQDLDTASRGDVRWKPKNSQVHNLLEVFIELFDLVKGANIVGPPGSILDDLATFGLLRRVSNMMSLSDDGRRFRNQTLAKGKFQIPNSL